ncbi:trypsin-like serine peptidase [Streptomyces sp. NPDC014603]|uniref:Peptidase n=2 Tax=unclassified Streptomyces TaxID=2593676 RepID=A0A6G3QTE3_9ACTN|nr:peptidase [Streptomyces sp. S12]NEA86773.1 peptidase [Streptomyces sp. SID14436]NEC79230.1 peptidase [Streptomyces sp. SID7958]
MRRNRTAAGILTALGALLAAGLSGAGTAGAAPSHPSGAAPAAAAHTVPHAQQQAARAYWTPDRMREATPLDLHLTPDAAKSIEPAPRGKTATVVPGAAPASFPQAGGPWTGGGAVVQTSGRVFFTFQGRTASCSGNAVTSQNASTVITAGHCVKYQGSWHTNWVFVPGYDNGDAPYGQWTATRTLTTPQWEASEDINHDVGAAVVAPLNGRTLTSVVGAQGIQFNGGYSKPMYAFGFPAASPYDGSKLIHCSGNSSKDFLFSQDHSLGCNMTGGSSGGPWFTGFDEATGTGLQVSVNSFGYTFLPNRMFGPYFGDVARALYDRAQTS